MRYLTAQMTPTENEAFHPIGEQLREEPSITREAIHHVELLANDIVLLFAEGSGDADRYEAIMEDSSHVDEYLVSGEERWMAVSQFTPSAVMRRLLQFERESDVVIETPIKINSDGSLLVTYVGRDTSFQAVFRRVSEDLSPTYDIIDTGSYDPDAHTLLRVSTTRQREVLGAALELGYYSAPRRATHADVADRIGIAPTTAGEHLRKIEERSFGTLIP
jgi:predicted DNA binding protein